MAVQQVQHAEFHAGKPSLSSGAWESLYPFAPHWLEVDGHQLHYVDEGKGQPILFVHGNPTWSFAYRNFINEFKWSHRCIAIDHLGCGKSAKPQDYPYLLNNRIEHLVKLVEKLDLENITLVAHDWGGAIGTGALGRMKERFARVVYMNTAAFRSKQIPLRIAACRIPYFGTLGVRAFNLFAGAAVSMAVTNKLSDKVAGGYLAPYNSWNNRVAVDAFVKDIPLNSTHPSYSALLEVEQTLKHVATLPTLLMWGMQDWCFSPHFLSEFKKHLPLAEVLEIPEASHYLFEDVPEKLNTRLRQFINQYPAV
jgi:haloalkane dehalogenase